METVDKDKVFVFGSNLAGIHGAGAAKYALEHYGAVMGIGEGLQGNSYALPTKDQWIKTLPLNKIEEHMTRFLLFAGRNPDKDFMLTPVGCGLAGYKRKDIWLMMRRLGVQAFENIYLTSSWVEPDTN